MSPQLYNISEFSLPLRDVRFLSGTPSSSESDIWSTCLDCQEFLGTYYTRQHWLLFLCFCSGTNKTSFQNVIVGKWSYSGKVMFQECHQMTDLALLFSPDVPNFLTILSSASSSSSSSSSLSKCPSSLHSKYNKFSFGFYSYQYASAEALTIIFNQQKHIGPRPSSQGYLQRPANTEHGLACVCVRMTVKV